MICTTYFLTFFSELIPPTGSNIMKLYILEKNRSTFTGKTAGNLIYSINIFTGLLEISMFFYDMTSVIEINLIYLTISGK